MCGIAGFIIKNQLSDAEARLKLMGDTIRHRGPDGEGYFVSPAGSGYQLGFAHRRLAILDLVTGNQPMFHESGVTLIFNGEIYNFLTLRRELEGLGHRFRTTSDTEVLLNSYVAWGPACVQRLRGMFAFALWDNPRGRLMLARDHFGKKPLYVYTDAQKLLFGSEVKAILAFGQVRVALDSASVADFLVYRYEPAPHPLFSGISKLMPGSYALWENGRLTERTFYAPPYGMEPDRGPPVANPVAEFGAVLEESVRIRMVSDVPYGAFLSGGLDSSTIVALMTRHTAHPVNTFSVGFPEAQYSELPYARMIADQFATRHTELTISADDLMEQLPTLIHHGDAPVGEASNIPIYLISREAAKSVKMVLTGEGADELLAGYPKHSAERAAALYQALVPAAFHRRLVELLGCSLPQSFRRITFMIQGIGTRNTEERMLRWLGGLSFEECDRLLVAHSARRVLDSSPFRSSQQRSALERILYFDQTSWLPDNLLERGDRITMAASIEARMPFMDTELAAFMARLPDRWRIRGFTQKYILRTLMRGVLPNAVLHRPKIGFRVPIREWFRGPMRGFVHDLICAPGSLAFQIFDRAALARILDR